MGKALVWVMMFAVGIAVGASGADGKKAPCPGCGPKAVGAVAAAKCPVDAFPVDRRYYVDVKGYRLFVCCPSCRNAVLKEPYKYLNQALKNGEVPPSAPPRKEKPERSNKDKPRP